MHRDGKGGARVIGVPLQPSGLWLKSSICNLFEHCSILAMELPMEGGTWLWLRSKLRRVLELRTEDNTYKIIIGWVWAQTVGDCRDEI